MERLEAFDALIQESHDIQPQAHAHAGEYVGLSRLTQARKQGTNHVRHPTAPNDVFDNAKGGLVRVSGWKA